MGRVGKVFLRNLWLPLILIFPPLLEGAEITPFYTQNQSPLVRIFGLPSIGNAAVLHSGKLT